MNSYNSTIKISRITEWMLKQHLFFCYIQETHVNIKGRCYFRVKCLKIIFHEHVSKKHNDVVILIYNKVDLKIKTSKKNMEKSSTYSL